jgi:membrane-associated protein
LNYQIGSWVGPAVFTRNYRLLKRSYLDRTHHFFEKYGGKTIIIGRFLPIIRTFAPFLAGVAKMTYFQFTIYNVIGSVAWISLFLFAGYFFGNIPVIKHNLTIVIFVIIALSVIPTAFEVIRQRFRTPKSPSNHKED